MTLLPAGQPVDYTLAPPAYAVSSWLLVPLTRPWHSPATYGPSNSLHLLLGAEPGVTSKYHHLVIHEHIDSAACGLAACGLAA